MTDVAPASRSVADVLALEAVAARSFPPIDSEDVAGWRLRASGGWTGRGNSALPLAVASDDPLADLDRVERWYAARALPPMVALPQPPYEAAAQELVRRGWEARHGALVLTARCADVLGSLPPQPDAPAVTVATVPDEPWLAAYHHGGRLPPPQAGAMLAASGARFVSLRRDAAVVGIVRSVVDGAWVGISAMEVAPQHRRQGWARHLLREVVAEATAAGAVRVWLQVEPTNGGARALYDGAGFGLHHTYRYYQRGTDARQEL